MHFISAQRPILVFFKMIDFDTDSKRLKQFHAVAILTMRVLFQYVGCTSQILALISTTSLEETIAIMAINIAYINATVKGTVFAWKKTGNEAIVAETH